MKNSTGRKLLEERYGKGCFIEKAGIRIITEEEEKELKRNIKGFKKLDRQITYHHIKQKSKGGKVSLENGANIADYNHKWLHSQPLHVQKEINDKLQEFKLQIDMSRLTIENEKIQVDKMNSIGLDFSECEYIEIPLYDNVNQKEKFNRAKVKSDTRNMIDEELYK